MSGVNNFPGPCAGHLMNQVIRQARARDIAEPCPNGDNRRVRGGVGHCCTVAWNQAGPRDGSAGWTWHGTIRGNPGGVDRLARDLDVRQSGPESGPQPSHPDGRLGLGSWWQVLRSGDRALILQSRVRPPCIFWPPRPGAGTKGDRPGQLRERLGPGPP